MQGRTRRLGAVTAAAAAAFALAATPAFAHFCSKSGWNDSALAHAAKSEAWLTADEWKGFIAEAEAGGEGSAPPAPTTSKHRSTLRGPTRCSSDRVSSRAAR